MLNSKKPLPDLLDRGIDDLFPNTNTDDPNQNLCKRLDQLLILKKSLRVKLGIDPTGTDIHLGHSILFRKLRAFQDAGHKAILIIGDFTARIGDPTGKSKTRIQLSEEEIAANSKTYLEQLGMGRSPENSLLDFSTPGRLEIHSNSEWLSKLNLSQVIDLMSNSTVGQMLAKEDFGNRYASGTPISMHEFLYPLLQGYDSVAVESDLELGGTDQKFNVAMGRDLQRAFNQTPQFGMLLPILLGIDGSQKMSKSLGNTVALSEDPLSMYSKLEKVPDDIVNDYLNLLTNIDMNNLPSNPRELQKLMAKEVTASIHGLRAAESAQSDAQKLILGNKESIQDVPEVSMSNLVFPLKAFYLVSAIGLSPTSSEARRQIKGGAIRIDGEKITDANLEFSNKKMLLGKIIQVGKKNFRRLSN